MRVLLTGFDPFGGESINPALEAVKQVKDYLGNIEIVKQEIPTVFNKSIEVLEQAINKYQPDYVICVGQAGGRFDLTLEKVAINYEDAVIADNEGNKPLDQAIFKDGETAYFASLPLKKMVEEIRKANVPASISYTAGTYVCNHLMYGLLYLIDKKYPHLKGGFIHVPFLTSQVIQKYHQPAMEQSTIVRGLEAAIMALQSPSEITNNSEGTTC